MATHDYDIANQSGANFRTDLNNCLDAIVSNNSNASDPSTTFAYMWWVDTSNNVLKLRNSANNAWITLPMSITASNTITPTLNMGTGAEEDVKIVFDGNAKDFYIALDDSADKLIIGEGSTVGTNPILSITDDTVTIGDGAAVDTSIVFDGNAKDFYLGLDDSADKLIIGEGSTVGTNSILTITDDSVTIGDGAAVDTKIVFDGNAQDYYIGLDDSADNLIVGKGSTVGTTPIISITENQDFLVRQTSAAVFDTNTGGDVRQFWSNQFSGANNTATKVAVGSGTGLALVGGATQNASSKFIINSYMGFANSSTTAGSESGFIQFFTSTGGAAGVERMRIDSSGVGVGTTSLDSHKMAIDSGAGTSLGLMHKSSNAFTLMTFKASGTSQDIRLGAVGNDMIFQTNGTERMRINSSGNVFLNQTATADSGVADGRLEITRASQHCLNCHVAGTGNSTLVAFINDNGFVGGINTNGSATVYNTSSDARLKNVLGEAKGLEVVNALNPVNFEWKSDGKIQDGLIAQEVEKVFPDAVSEPELKGEWYSVDYSKLVTPLIKGMQEQQTQIESLQSEINALKGE